MKPYDNTKSLGTFLIICAFFFFTTPKAFACNDGTFYRHCQDQQALYQQALQQAQGEQKTLVIVVGYEACVWCRSLGNMFNGFTKSQDPLIQDFVFEEIATHHYNSETEKFEKIPTGLAVRDQLLSQLLAPQEISGYPTLFVVNPQTQFTVMIETGPLEKNDESQGIYGHDQEKIIAALYQGKEAVAANAASSATRNCSEITGD